jgi:His-Xaa-Ser system protein HxsD
VEAIRRRQEASCGLDQMTDKPVIAWTLDQAHVAVPIDLSVFSIDAAVRAAYKFTDRCFVLLERDTKIADRLLAFMIGRSPKTDLTTVVLEFKNELVDQQLRCRLEQQFKDVRTLIVAQAFSEGNLIDSDADAGDYHTDPLSAGQHR